MFSGMPLYLPRTPGNLGETTKDVYSSAQHDLAMQCMTATYSYEMSTGGGGPWLVRVQCSYNQNYSSSQCLWLQSSDGLPTKHSTIYIRDVISPDEQTAGSGTGQEIAWKQIRNWRGQCRCDDGSIALIGRRFGDGGLSVRLIEIGIVPAGSISGVLVER